MSFYDFFPTLPKLPDAACRDYPFPELFFPDSRKQEAKSLPLAQAICAGCLTRKECLDYALKEQIPHGIWAGTTPEMRGILPVEKRRGLNRINNADKIRSLYRLGRTSKEIAQILKVDVSYVNTVIKRESAKLEGENQSQPIAKLGEESPSSSGFQQ